MNEVVLDTETTGLSVRDGHRIVEIGCIELDNGNIRKNRTIDDITKRRRYKVF